MEAIQARPILPGFPNRHFHSTPRGNRFLGMNGLKDVTVTSFALPGDDPSHHGIQLQIQVLLQNPTVAAMSGIGDITFAITFEGQEMGQVTAKNLALAPGPNNISLAGYIAPNASGLDAAAKFFAQYLQDKPSLIDCHAISSTRDILWVQKVVKSLKMQTNLDGANISILAGLEPIKLNFALSATAPPMFGGQLKATIDFPFGFSYHIINISLTGTLVYQNQNIGSFTIPTSPCIHTGSQLYLNFSNAPINVINDQQFSGFLKWMFLNPNVTLGLVASSSSALHIPFGTINLKDLVVKDSLVVEGLNNFENPPIYIKHPLILNGTSDSLTFTLDIYIFNPSNNYLSLGSVTLDVIYEDVNICNGTVNPLSLNPGQNIFTIVSTVKQSPTTAPKFRKFLSAYLSRR